MSQAGRFWALALLGWIAGWLGIAPSAAAQEPALDWSGFYVGGQLGGAWSDSDWDYENANWFNTLGPVIVITDFGVGGDGIVGGGQAGFNYQTGAWVFGVEGSLAGTGIDETTRSPFFSTTDTDTVEVDWLATVTGRLGYARDRWLAYAKAGWAGADIDLILFDHGTPVRASSSTWADGWTVGGGGEYALGGGFSLGVEYDYIDLVTGRFAVACPTCPAGIGGGVPAVSGDVTLQTLTGRLNYRFGN